MRLVSVLLAATCLLPAALAVQPDFDAREVVRQVHGVSCPAAGVEQSFDDGEFLIDTSVTLVPAPNAQSQPAIAFDGANFLVVWQDSRDAGGIYGARVTQSGTVLDSVGFVIKHGWSAAGAPALAFDGVSFLVVWAEYRSDCDIYGARVTPQGTVLDPSGIVISQAANYQESPALGFDGANFLVVWRDFRSGSDCDIYGARVTPQGTVLDPSGVVISQAAHSQWSPALSFDGTGFLVAWQDSRSGSGDTDIYGTRVTPSGIVIDPEGIVISTAEKSQETPVLAFDGTNFLVAWQDGRSGDPDIYGARVTQSGTLLDHSGIAVSTAADMQGSPALAFDGTSFFVAWQDGRNAEWDIYGSRVTTAGTVLDPDGIVISQADNWQDPFPACAFDGTNTFVVWAGEGGGGLDIYGSRVTPQGAVLDPDGIPISQTANDQRCPAAAFDGVNFLVVWEDHRDGSDIYGARVSLSGTVLDPSGFVISQAPGDQVSTAVVFDGLDFLVVWQDGPGDDWDICGARVTPSGTVLDPGGFTISEATSYQWSPALAFDGTNSLVVWTDYRSGLEPDIYGARVTTTGTVLDPDGIVILQGYDEQRYPAIAFDGTNFLVAWQDYRSSFYDIYGARVTPQGTVLDPSGIVISTAAGSQWYPAAAFDGTNFLVVWVDNHGGYYTDICGARVTPQGTVLDPSGIAVSTAAGSWLYPAVAFDGTSFLVLWQDRRNGDYDIYGAWVAPTGTVSGEGPVVRQDANQLNPELCRGSGDQVSLVYQGWAGTVGGKTYNTDRIWGKMNPSPAVEETPKPGLRVTNRGPTIVRGVLVLSAAGSRQNTGYRAELLDAAGRKVMELAPGPNDVSRLTPGVYFVQAAGRAEKFIVQR